MPQLDRWRWVRYELNYTELISWVRPSVLISGLWLRMIVFSCMFLEIS